MLRSALEADPAREHTDVIAIVLANRAHVRIKLALACGKWSAPAKYREAIMDATEAVQLKPR